MNDFTLFFGIGIKHILDINALDHILFIIALCLRFTATDWRKLIWLITAFTLGHFVALIITFSNIIAIKSVWVEFFIAFSIVLVAINNLFVKSNSMIQKSKIIYCITCFFGLIHGMGFSNYLRSLFGKTSSILIELIGFNIGLELGQVTIVAAVLFITFACLNILKLNKREYILVVSGCIIGMSLDMMISRIPF